MRCPEGPRPERASRVIGRNVGLRAKRPTKGPAKPFQIPETITVLRNITNTYEVGRACGELLYSITSLVAYHLDQSADCQNEPQRASISTSEFTAAVDAYLHFLRIYDGCSERFPNGIAVDRKGRRARRKYRERYIFILETRFKNALHEALGGMMKTWTEEQIEKFNKGVDKVLSGAAWTKYPGKNVCLEAGESDWGVWLRGKCEELGIVEAKVGRRVFDDL
ncbi:hypothetical protein K458DRAFT_481042 [Lentithecium fluviatile CBS 122367]|uniref:Uncharacterized protein n=1 Tax=Lentithecium fluviatile CBS 122367 TaxID=1168545 RepID=A0A6G1IIV7_9PLEO|nr:hypothetical protein K458DRAFT_481042 [Lentithecium fluviatile CBS 122367]